MTLSPLTVVGLLVSGALVAPSADLLAPAGRQPEEMPYETLMAQHPKERAEIFCSLAVHNQASIMTTHLTRWREAHRGRLSPAEDALVEEWLRLLTPMFYVVPRLADIQRRHEDLQARTDQTFSKQDLVEAFTLLGPYRPPQ